MLAAALSEQDPAALQEAFLDTPASMMQAIGGLEDRLLRAAPGYPALQAIFDA